MTNKYHSKSGFRQWVTNRYPDKFKNNQVQELDIEYEVKQWVSITFYRASNKRIAIGQLPKFLESINDYFDNDYERIQEFISEKVIPKIVQLYDK